MSEPTPDKKATKREKGRSYPATSLAECVGFIEHVSKKLGTAISYERDQIAEAIGYSPSGGATFAKVAAIVHFGLMDVSAGAYKLTDSARRILRPCTPEEKTEEIRRAFYRPKLYADLMGAFTNAGSVPTHLENILCRNYGVSDFACSAAARAFLDSARFAGVLGGNNQILSASPSSQNQDVTSLDNVPSLAPAQTSRNSPGIASDSRQKYEIPLSTGKAVLDLPKEISEKDLNIIRKVIELLELQVSLGRSSEL